ncbi:MAG TPA: peptide ABC transporter substrate-binding protein [Gemmatimonadaceae bacterium]|nr:peptide ABC transporter substrate-binding protein [Gemmatimonadaceae bacterium]
MRFARRVRDCCRVVGCSTLALGASCAQAHDPSRDHTLVVALAAEPTLLLPPLLGETPGFIVADQILERLAEPDSTLDTRGDRAFRPRLAERWTWADDSLSIAFLIAANARWHDGLPVTAHDVRFTFALYTDTAVASPAASLLADIDSVQVRNERVAVFWFHRRHAQQFFDATYHMRILPEHLLADLPRPELRHGAFARAPTGSGPFRFARWVPGQLLELESDTTYRGGRSQFRRLVFTIAPDPSAALIRALDREVDVLSYVEPAQIARVARSRTLSPVRWASLSSGLVMLNLHDPGSSRRPHAVLGDRSVRRALTMAVDRARLTSAALGKSAIPATGPLPAPLLHGAPALLPQPDLPRAVSLLDDAGWHMPSDRDTRRRDGTPLRFTLLVSTTAPAGQRVAVLMQDELRRAGANMDVETVDNATLAARLSAHRFDAALVALDWDPSPFSARQLWGTPTNPAAETSNFSGYSDPMFDSLIAAADIASDSTTAHVAERRAWQTLVRDAPAIWLYDFERVAALRRCVQPKGVRADAWWAGLSRWTVRDGCQS